ncbi:MAG: 2-oxo acid dehydrogenase subunit E2 [Acidimicrobiales bacterium]|nr:2-oxo acid dehydrogenase subunit E2 [Acidimicrobiales bacterium]
MANVEMPQLGETVTEGTITRWFKQIGDSVAVDEVLFEVSTDKVDSEVPSPAAGVLTEILVPEGETVEVGAVLAVIGDGAAQPAAAPESASVEPEPEPEPAQQPDPEPASQPAPEPAPQPQPAAPAAPAPAAQPAAASDDDDNRLLSPVVRRLIRENNLDAAAIQGTGVGGRITRKDVLDAIDAGASSAREAQPAPAPQPAAQPQPAPAPAPAPAPQPAAQPQPAPAPAAAQSTAVGTRSEFVAFNNIRRRTGEHMVHSKAIAPHALTVMEVDYEGVSQVRSVHKAAFKEAEGFSLTFLPFIVRAVVDALGDWPYMNASVEGEGLRVHRDVNIGIAVDLEGEGLIVPVIRNADGMRLKAIARSINDLADRARSKALGVDDITGGTFTLSNNGSFGTYTTAAIINQPQVAVLSTDGIARRPVVVSDRFGSESIAIHSVGHLAMSWDHRAFDGSYAAGFLRQVKQTLETRDWATEL